MSAVQIEIIAVFPPYYAKLQRKRFKEMIHTNTFSTQTSVKLINRDEACVACFEMEEGFQDERMTTVIACYMEEDVTVCLLFLSFSF
jgi:hypothetical protein